MQGLFSLHEKTSIAQGKRTVKQSVSPMHSSSFVSGMRSGKRGTAMVTNIRAPSNRWGNVGGSSTVTSVEASGCVTVMERMERREKNVSEEKGWLRRKNPKFEMRRLVPVEIGAANHTHHPI